MITELICGKSPVNKRHPMSLGHPVSGSVALLSLLSLALSFETSRLLRLIIATIMRPNNRNSCSNQSEV